MEVVQQSFPGTRIPVVMAMLFTKSNRVTPLAWVTDSQLMMNYYEILHHANEYRIPLIYLWR